MKVSVILPAFNAEETIGRAVESILGQSFSGFELIALNDGSTDRTGEILDSYRDSRLVVVHKPKEGLARTLNRGIGLAKGEYIARMDADDESFPKRLEEQVCFLDRNPEIVLVGTAVQIVTSEDHRIRRFPRRHDEIVRHILKFNPISHPTVMIRKWVLEAVGGYNPTMDGSLGLSSGEDYHLWVILVSRGYQLANLGAPLLKQHRGSTSIMGGWNLLFKLRGRVRMRLWIKNRLNLGPIAYWTISWVLAFTLLNHFGFKMERIINYLSEKKS
jgi:glycosyltransferase involved in cell wall biosynthesis